MRLVELSKQSHSFFKDLPAKQFKQIAKAIFSLAENPQQADVKLLKGYSAEKFFRKDVGEFRIVFFETETVLKIVVVEKRNDDAVYKILCRKTSFINN